MLPFLKRLLCRYNNNFVWIVWRSVCLSIQQRRRRRVRFGHSFECVREKEIAIHCFFQSIYKKINRTANFVNDRLICMRDAHQQNDNNNNNNEYAVQKKEEKVQRWPMAIFAFRTKCLSMCNVDVCMCTATQHWSGNSFRILSAGAVAAGAKKQQQQKQFTVECVSMKRKRLENSWLLAAWSLLIIVHVSCMHAARERQRRRHYLKPTEMHHVLCVYVWVRSSYGVVVFDENCLIALRTS